MIRGLPSFGVTSVNNTTTSSVSIPAAVQLPPAHGITLGGPQANLNTKRLSSGAVILPGQQHHQAPVTSAPKMNGQAPTPDTPGVAIATTLKRTSISGGQTANVQFGSFNSPGPVNTASLSGHVPPSVVTQQQIPLIQGHPQVPQIFQHQHQGVHPSNLPQQLASHQHHPTHGILMASSPVPHPQSRMPIVPNGADKKHHVTPPRPVNQALGMPLHNMDLYTPLPNMGIQPQRHASSFPAHTYQLPGFVQPYTPEYLNSKPFIQPMQHEFYQVPQGYVAYPPNYQQQFVRGQPSFAPSYNAYPSPARPAAQKKRLAIVDPTTGQEVDVSSNISKPKPATATSEPEASIGSPAADGSHPHSAGATVIPSPSVPRPSSAASIVDPKTGQQMDLSRRKSSFAHDEKKETPKAQLDLVHEHTIPESKLPVPETAVPVEPESDSSSLVKEEQALPAPIATINDRVSAEPVKIEESKAEPIPVPEKADDSSLVVEGSNVEPTSQPVIAAKVSEEIVVVKESDAPSEAIVAQTTSKEISIEESKPSTEKETVTEPAEVSADIPKQAAENIQLPTESLSKETPEPKESLEKPAEKPVEKPVEAEVQKPVSIPASTSGSLPVVVPKSSSPTPASTSTISLVGTRKPNGVISYTKEQLLEMRNKFTTMPAGLTYTDIIDKGDAATRAQNAPSRSRNPSRSGSIDLRAQGGFNAGTGRAAGAGNQSRRQSNAPGQIAAPSGQRSQRGSVAGAPGANNPPRQGRGRGPAAPATPSTDAGYVAPIVPSANAWKRGQFANAESEDAATEKILRATKSLLNKLTLEKFDKISNDILNVGITNIAILRGIITLIFDKALDEPKFSSIYAKLCLQLSRAGLRFEQNQDFRRILLSRCQEVFEKRSQLMREKTTSLEGKTPTEVEEILIERSKAKHRILGNIVFIGELFMLNILTEKIMHECVVTLLSDVNNPEPDEIESLCKLLNTIGKIIDHPDAKKHMDTYESRLKTLTNNKDLPIRIRFMIKDVLDLRANNWKPRRDVLGPKTIEEVHKDAMEEKKAAAAPQPYASGRESGSRGGPGFGAGRSSGQGGYPPQGGNMRSTSGRNGPAPPADDWKTVKSNKTGDMSAFGSVKSAYVDPKKMSLAPNTRGNFNHGAKGWKQDNRSDNTDSKEKGSRSNSTNRYNALLPESGQERQRSQERNESGAQSSEERVVSPPPTIETSSSPAPALGAEELKSKLKNIFAEFISEKSVSGAILDIKEIQVGIVPQEFAKYAVEDMLDRSPNEVPLVAQLCVEMVQQTTLTANDFLDGLREVSDILEDIVVDVPHAYDFVGELLKQFLSAKLIEKDHLEAELSKWTAADIGKLKQLIE